MKKDLLRSSLTLAAFLSLGVFAFAQHGRAGGAGMGGGPPMGAGGPGMGAGASMGNGGGMGPGNYGRPSNPGPGMGRGSTSGSSMASQAPEKVLSNSKLDSSLSNALGKSGITVPGGNLQTACAGFKNLGSCVAALHVAKNLNLNFADLQNLMTGPHRESLGKAVQSLGRANTKAKGETKKAVKQAKHDLNTAASASMTANS
jgi:hypothetical protein